MMKSHETPVTGDYDSSKSFNDDAITEILVRLPAKSLIRFKLVCKHWNSQISSHFFSHLHAKHHPNPQRSLLLCTEKTSQFFYFRPTLNDAKLIPYRFPSPYPKILNSCNGLMLLQCDDPVKKYHVVNPTTGLSRIINLTTGDSRMHVFALILAFDPLKSPHYKIACIRGCKHLLARWSLSCEIDLYDSESLTWRLCVKSFTSTDLIHFPSGVHWNNRIHWQFQDSGDYMYYDIGKNAIGHFPDAVVPWHEIPIGVENDNSQKDRSFLQLSCHSRYDDSHGNLYHFIIFMCWEEMSIGVFELQEDYSGWLLKYAEPLGRFSRNPTVFAFVREELTDTSFFIFHIPGKIMTYKLADKSFKELVDLTNTTFYEENTSQFEEGDIFQFSETLALV